MDELSPDELAEFHGYVPKESLPDLARIKDQLLGAVESMYVTGDVYMLESCMDEIMHELDIKTEHTTLQITKRDSTLLTWYKDLQKEVETESSRTLPHRRKPGKLSSYHKNIK